MPAFLASITSFAWSWDLILIAALVVGSMVNAFLLGRKLAVATMVSLYMATVVTIFFPFTSLLTSALPLNEGVVRMLLFGVVLVLAELMIVRSRLRYLIDRHERMGTSQVFLLSLLEVGMLIAILVGFASDAFIANLRPMTELLFHSAVAQFVWVTLPVVALIGLKR